MNRAFPFILLALVLLLPTVGTSLPEPETPELEVMLVPAFGVVPLAEHSRESLYTFQISAMDRRQHKLYALAQALVAPGESRRVDKETPRGTHLVGSVNLTRQGVASYNAELSMGGVPIARTNATVTLQAQRP